MSQVTAFAPATVGNAAVGFDILGFALEGVGDRITVQKKQEPGVSIQAIKGVPGSELITLDPTKNTATVGLLELIRDLTLPFGFQVSMEKGIPLGSGMGGSAASAVGAIVAASELLKQECGRALSRADCLRYALLGEFVASGSSHADNAAPCLYGGLTLILGVGAQDEIVSIPVPREILCVLVHPHLKLETKEMRRVLKREVPLIDVVHQSALLAGFVSGCYEGNLERVGRSLSDVLIEPQREIFIPGFKEAKRAALKAGALGFSISGSGPSVFAWARSPVQAAAIQQAIQAAIKKQGIESDAWISPIASRGAYAESTP